MKIKRNQILLFLLKDSVFYGMQVSKFLLSLALIYTIACRPAYNIQKTEQTTYIFSDTSNTIIDSSVYEIILPYKEKLTGEMNTILGESETSLERGNPESKLGNFVSMACMTESAKIYYPKDGRQADFAFFNNGGLRRPLPAGKITRGDVFELMPFENELVVLTIDGEHVEKIFNFIASKNGAPIDGARFQIKDSKAKNIIIQNIPLDTTKTYKVLTSDYLANGGDSYDFLKDIPREYVNLKVRDALIQYISIQGKQGKKISVLLDGRISHAE